MTCNNGLTDMNGVIEKLDLSLGVSQSTKIFNPHYTLYKNKSNGLEPEKRREEFIKNQKAKREENLMKIRCLTNISLEIDDDFSDGDDESSMDSEDINHKPGSRNQPKTEHFNPYKDQLMLSEWLTEKPRDFVENWSLVICPTGKRCLVISHSGQTRAYSRTGHFMRSFPSYLPGGNRRDNCAYKKSAVVDCIFSEIDKTFFILDVMAWNQSTFYDSDVELRLYWLSSRIAEEYSQMLSVDRLNPFKFVLLKHHKCDDQSIINAIQSYSYKPKIDGLLFFHKKSHYIPEVSPLVCWLKLNMLKNVLGIEVDLPNQMDIGIED